MPHLSADLHTVGMVSAFHGAGVSTFPAARLVLVMEDVLIETGLLPPLTLELPNFCLLLCLKLLHLLTSGRGPLHPDCQGFWPVEAESCVCAGLGAALTLP